MARRILTAVVVGVAVLAVGWGVLHVVIPPVNPRQEAPAGHWTAPCWTCHIVTESAAIIDSE